MDQGTNYTTVGGRRKDGKTTKTLRMLQQLADEGKIDASSGLVIGLRSKPKALETPTGFSPDQRRTRNYKRSERKMWRQFSAQERKEALDLGEKEAAQCVHGHHRPNDIDSKNCKYCGTLMLDD